MKVNTYDQLKSAVSELLPDADNPDNAWLEKRDDLVGAALRRMAKGNAGYLPKWSEQLAQLFYEGD